MTTILNVVPSTQSGSKGIAHARSALVYDVNQSWPYTLVLVILYEYFTAAEA